MGLSWGYRGCGARATACRRGRSASLVLAWAFRVLGEASLRERDRTVVGTVDVLAQANLWCSTRTCRYACGCADDRKLGW